MGEKELGRALLDLDAQNLAGLPDTREQTWKILERDRRRVWWWTAITFLLWGAAILMVLWMLIAFGLLFPFQAMLEMERQGVNVLEAEPPLTPHELDLLKHNAQVAFQMITLGVTCAVGVLALAALATVLLVRASRRATLRQINANLLEITQQLKALRETMAPPKPQ